MGRKAGTRPVASNDPRDLPNLETDGARTAGQSGTHADLLAIDAMLQDRWKKYPIAPTLIFPDPEAAERFVSAYARAVQAEEDAEANAALRLWWKRRR